MAFTYTGNLDTDLDRVRFRIGDTDSTDALLTDAEINAAVTAEGTVVKAALACVKSILARFSKGYDFATDGQSFSRSQRVAHYQQLLVELRTAAGVSSVATTRQDAYSDDIPYDDVESTTSTGRVRVGYTDPDLPL